MPTDAPALRRNIELKARCPDLAAARRAAIQLGAESIDVFEQTDTYFRTNHGRLKLRETKEKRDELIWYDRPDHRDARGSDFRLVSVTDTAALKAALSAALGVRGVVKKRREFLTWRNVRIHLDVVENLGTFIEFEAVLTDSSDETTSFERVETLARAVRIDDADRIATSYADQLGF